MRRIVKNKKEVHFDPDRSGTEIAEKNKAANRRVTRANCTGIKNIVSDQSVEVITAPSLFFLTARDIKKEKKAVETSWTKIKKNMKKGIQEFPFAEHVLPFKGDSIKRFSALFEEFNSQKIGDGQFGVVHRGLHRESGRKVAIKVIDKDKSEIIKFRLQILKNEIAILQSLDHPAIVKLECMLEVPSKIVIVMEGMQGDAFSFMEEKGVMNERLVKVIMIQVLSAVQYLHARGIVHCDLKPENILLSDFDSPLPQAKLCDFGFARFLEDGEVCKELVGTAAYSAPEVTKMDGFDKSSDMWSLGVATFVTLSGDFPFNDSENITSNDILPSALFNGNKWRDNISSDAKGFIISLLEIWKSRRLDTEAAMRHCWFEDCRSDLNTFLERQLGIRTNKSSIPVTEVKQSAARNKIQTAVIPSSPADNRTRRRMTECTRLVGLPFVSTALINSVELEKMPKNMKVPTQTVQSGALRDNDSRNIQGKRRMAFKNLDDASVTKKSRKSVENPKKTRLPTQARNYYEIDNRDRVREQYPHLNSAQIQQLLREEWKSLQDKSKWRAMAAADKLRFNEENNWQRPRRAIDFWMKACIPKILFQNPEILPIQAMAQANKEWLELQDKSKWMVMAEQANQRQLDEGVQWSRKRPRPAYMFYEIENRDRMRKLHSNLNYKQIEKLVQAEWKTLPDKSKWKQLAAKDKLWFEKQPTNRKQ